MTPRSKKPDEFDWRKLVNEMEVGPFAEQDDDEPPSEMEENEEEEPTGRYTKLVFEVNLFTTTEPNKCVMIVSSQRMFDFGMMTLSEAVVKAKGGKRKR